MPCVLSPHRGCNIEGYVHEYYSIAKFKKAYQKCVKPMADRKQWPQVNLGFKLWPPILKPAAGRPRKRRLKSAAEGGSGKRTTRCKRCKQLGHMQKTCNEYVYDDSDTPPPTAPKPKRKRGKKIVTLVPSSVAEPSQEQPSHADPFMSRRLLEYEASTPTRAIASISTPSPLTRSRKRMLELEGNIEHVQCLALSPDPAHEKGKPKKLKVVRSKKA